MLPFLYEISIPFPRKLKVPLGDLLRLLLKRMQDVYSFRKLRYIEDPMLQGGANSQLVDARAYTSQGLPVIRLKPLLDKVKLMAGNTPRILRECSQVLKNGADPEERFHRLEPIYKFLYRDARARGSGFEQRTRLWMVR